MINPREIITPQEKLTEVELEAYNLLVPKHRRSALDPKETIEPKGPYKETAVTKDEEEVRRLEGIFQLENRKHPARKENMQRGELFEALLAERIELDDWFGQDAKTIVPSRYDDIRNGVDLLVEFESELGFFKHLGLSIDATTHIPSITEKIEAIKRAIERGQLTSLKYFYSEKTGNSGVLKDLPKVIVAADFRTIREIAGLWIRIQKLRARKLYLEKNSPDHPELAAAHKQIITLVRQLANHRIQFQILEEIKAQLTYFQNYAEDHCLALRKLQVIEKYRSALETINYILENKEATLADEDKKSIENDMAYQAIMKEVS